MSTPRTPIRFTVVRGAALVLAFAALFGAQPTPARAGETTGEKPATGGIQWFASWTQAKAEAARTQRPILLTAAAPHCRGISGMW